MPEKDAVPPAWVLTPSTPSTLLPSLLRSSNSNHSPATASVPPLTVLVTEMVAVAAASYLSSNAAALVPRL